MTNKDPFPLYVVYLEDSSEDRQLLEDAFGEIRKRFCDFIDIEFPTDDKHTPEEVLQCKFVESTGELRSVVFGEDYRLTDVGTRTVFFLLDYYVVESKGDKPTKELRFCEIDGMPFVHWLEMYFPVIPKLILTNMDEDQLCSDIKDRIPFISKDKIIHQEKFGKRLGYAFTEWWQPVFWKALYDYADVSGDDSWHTPGHNSGTAFAGSRFQKEFYKAYGSITFSTDLSVSVDELGDLSEPDHVSDSGEPTALTKSMQKNANIFGAVETLYVTNGTSTSNKALLMTLLRPGETVLLDRNCHKSVHQAVVMSGAIPIYLTPAFNETLGIWLPLTITQLQSFLNADYGNTTFKPRLLILTTCTYEGVLYPIRKIATMCERNGIVFCADEAWAPYLRFHPYYVSRTKDDDKAQEPNRYNAMDGGAHFAVQSTHKALAAFSQASMIHVSESFEDLFSSDNSDSDWEWLQKRFNVNGAGAYSRFRHEFHEVLRYWHSTSPHYPMLASLDRAGIQMRLEGMLRIGERLEWVNSFEKRVAEICPTALLDLPQLLDVTDIHPYFSGYMKDPLKIVLRVKDVPKFKSVLKDKNIRWEKATNATIEFLVTIGTQRGNINDLTEAMRQGSRYLGDADVTHNGLFPQSQTVDVQVDMTPRYAALGDGELVEISNAAGRISAQMIVPYPPGIPVYLPGLRITEEMVKIVMDVLAHSGKGSVHGVIEVDDKYYTKVVTEKEENVFQELCPKELQTIQAVQQFVKELT